MARKADGCNNQHGAHEDSQQDRGSESVVWYDIVRYGIVWHGMVLNCLIWYSIRWFGISYLMAGEGFIHVVVGLGLIGLDAANIVGILYDIVWY